MLARLPKYGEPRSITGTAVNGKTLIIQYSDGTLDRHEINVQDGTSVKPEEIRDLVVAELSKLSATLQPAVYDETGKLQGVGSPITIPLDGTPALLPPAGIKVQGASGRETVTQVPLGGIAPFQMGKL